MISFTQYPSDIYRASLLLHCHLENHTGSVKTVVWCLLFLFYREHRDTYYCMLFNDEVHTYEQVIYTLQKAVNCSQKEAVSFATTVDRDVSSLSGFTVLWHSPYKIFVSLISGCALKSKFLNNISQFLLCVVVFRGGSLYAMGIFSSVSRPSLLLW